MNLLNGCALLRDYESLSKTGSGGCGLVIRAKKKNENFYSAIKLIPVDTRMVGRDMLSEATKAFGISKHDSVVACLDYWEDLCTKPEHEILLRLLKPKKQEPFYNFPTNEKQFKFVCIKMEFCENGTLKSWLKERKDVNVSESIQIFLQLARGIEHIHAHKLIHRDFKPANILFRKKNAKISDFGWSAIHNVGDYQHTPGAGAALYQAPEQAFGTYGPATDYYALGLILFELFYPEAQKNIGLTITQMKYIRDIPMEIKRKYPLVAELIKKLISVDPKERPKCKYIVKTIRELLDVSIPKFETKQLNDECNECHVPLIRIKYKCSICPNYFLCETCEEDCDHIENHHLLKIKTCTPHTNNEGCQHYRRKCLLKCPAPKCGTLNGFYACRICHDEDIKGHKMDRFGIQEILCNSCGMKQFPRRTCLLCTNAFAKYFCSNCNLFDDSEEAKLIYHCFLCGICRKKKNASIEYKHCNRCAMCFPYSITDGTIFIEHECNEGAGKIPCSVCNKAVHDSREAAILTECHHYVHLSCRLKFPDGVELCPLCGNW